MLVLRPGALGDTLLAVPALRALRDRFSPLVLAAHWGAARLLEWSGEIDRGLAFDDPSLGWMSGDAPPGNEPIVAWLDAQAVPAVRHARVLAPSRPPTDNEHCAAYLVGTLAPLGIALALDERALRVPAIASEEVLIHPGSGSLRKNWPAQCFADVIRTLDRQVRLVVGEADLEPALAIEAHLGRRLPRLEQPTLQALASRLAGCHAYLGNDSGVSHLAGLCGARTVVLFGPTPATVWRPLGPDVHVASFDASLAWVVRRLTNVTER